MLRCCLLALASRKNATGTVHCDCDSEWVVTTRVRLWWLARGWYSIPTVFLRDGVVWVLGEKLPQGRVRKTFVFSSRRVPVPIVFGVGSLVSPSVDATPYPLTVHLSRESCVVWLSRLRVG